MFSTALHTRARATAPHRSSHKLALLLGLSLLPVVGCNSDKVSGSRNTDPLTVTGTLTGPNLATLPEGARVAVIWTVTAASPDYGYIYGTGTIDRAAGTFSITLPSAPPSEALNHYGAYRLGVGVLVVFEPGADLRARRLDESDPLVNAAIGAAGQYAVIYTGGTLTAAPLDWPRDFPAGYGVGRGVPQVDTYDSFEPVGPGSVEITIDDPENIEFVNWT